MPDFLCHWARSQSSGADWPGPHCLAPWFQHWSLAWLVSGNAIAGAAEGSPGRVEVVSQPGRWGGSISESTMQIHPGEQQCRDPQGSGSGSWQGTSHPSVSSSEAMAGRGSKSRLGGRNSLRDIDGVSGVQALLSLELPGDTGCWRHEQGLEVLKVTG